MQVELRWVTPDAEQEIAIAARGSNPPNQYSDEWKRLFNFCLGGKDIHWSILSMVNMVVRIETSLAIAAQFKRHWSLANHGPEDLQEASFRYMSPTEYNWGYEPITLHAQGKTNRQMSGELLTGDVADEANELVEEAIRVADANYRRLIDIGASREDARGILPTATRTRFYVNGTARSWATYFIQRLSPHAQQAHQELATALYDLYEPHFPTVCKILFKRVNGRVVLIDKAADRIAELEAEVATLKAQLAEFEGEL